MGSHEGQLSSFLNTDSMNEKFFIEIVEHKLNISRNDFKIKLVFISPATGKNENYVSLVLRTKIKIQLLSSGKCELVDVIIKATPEPLAEISELSVYEREKFVYENLIQNFERIWKEKSGEEVKFAPKALKFEPLPYEIIVMDDLKAAGYVMMDRKEGLNLEYSKIFLDKLAKFHAAGAVQYQKCGPMKDFLDRSGQLSTEVDVNNSFNATFIRLADEFGKAVRSYKDCDIYAEKIEKWDKVLAGTCYFYESYPMKCGLQVLNHGDVWVNNMMFKSNPSDVLMFDFQLCFWGSPTYDILLFLILSVQDDIKVEHFDDLIQFYQQRFSESLAELGYERHIPTLEEFMADFQDKGHVAASFLAIIFFAKFSTNEEFTLEKLMRETDETVLQNIFTNILSDELVVKATKIWLPFMDSRGYLDALIPK